MMLIHHSGKNIKKTVRGYRLKNEEWPDPNKLMKHIDFTMKYTSLTFQKRLCQLLSANATQISNELWSEWSFIAKTTFNEVTDYCIL